jgi:hypothetical protein
MLIESACAVGLPQSALCGAKLVEHRRRSFIDELALTCASLFIKEIAMWMRKCLSLVLLTSAFGAAAVAAPYAEYRVTEALNNRNQVTGESGQLILPEIPFYAFVWSKGVTRQLGDFGYTPSYGLDINDCGQVAGNSDDLGAFVYRGKRRESLNALIDPRSGWDITFSRGINDAGQIIADGVRGGVQYAVRLDLIRPHGLGAPAIEADDEAGVAAAAQVEGETQ